MAQENITTELHIATESEADANKESVISIDDVTMVFNIASEQLNNLKEYFIALARRELMFKEFKALQHINIEVKKGDVFGILGTNGSGKSTLLKVIAGVLDPTSGTCTVRGNIAPLIELGAGFDQDLTARENVYLNGALLGYPRKFIDQHFDEIVEFAEVEEFLDMPIKNYSSGMVSRIAFAIATVIVPEILLVDEVLSVGDFMFQKKCENRIKELIEKHNVTVLLVSHSNDQVARLCNKAVWIEKGHMRMSGNAQDVCRVYSALGGRAGSAESEQKIFQIMKDTPHGSNFTVGCETIYDNNSHGFASRLAFQRLEAAPTKTAVIAAETSHINAAFGSSLAGALDAVLLQSSHFYIDPSIEALLFKHRPETFYVLNCGQSSEGLVTALQNLEWNPKVIDLSKPAYNPVNYSLFLAEYGNAHNLWGDTAFLVDFEDTAATSAIQAELYACASPLLCTWMSKPECLSESIAQNAQTLASYGIKNIGILGNIVPQDMADQLGDTLNAFPLGRGESSISRRCLDIAKHLYLELEKNNASDGKIHIAFASNDPSQTLHLCSICNKTQRDSMLILTDSADMDDTIALYDYLTSLQGRILSISFLGSEDIFFEEDRDIIRAAIG